MQSRISSRLRASAMNSLSDIAGIGRAGYASKTVIRFVAALACAVAALTVPARARAFAPIPITVRAEDDVARHRWPLTVSVPFARGLLQRGQAVKVVDEHGGAAPVQARPLVTWPDGSVRWLLLDTQVDVKPGTRIACASSPALRRRPPRRCARRKARTG